MPAVASSGMFGMPANSALRLLIFVNTMSDTGAHQARKSNPTNATPSTRGNARIANSPTRAHRRGWGSVRKKAMPKPVATNESAAEEMLARSTMPSMGTPQTQP